MHIYVSQQQADAYLRGLLVRLQLIDDPDETIPKLPLSDRRSNLNNILWVTIGGSGERILQYIIDLLKVEFTDLTSLDNLNAIVSTESNWAKFMISDSQPMTYIQSMLREIPNRNVVIVDDVVRTGLSMSVVHAKVRFHKAKTVTSYALGLKCGSCYVPSYFAMMTNDTDHVYIQRKHILTRQIVTDRLNVDGESIHKFGAFYTQHLRNSLNDPNIVKSRLIAMNKVVSQQQTQNYQTYVCEINEGLGAFVIFDLVPAQYKCMVYELCQFNTDSCANAALSLMRFIELYARHYQCQLIEMAGATTEQSVDTFKNEGYLHQKGRLYKKLY